MVLTLSIFRVALTAPFFSGTTAGPWPGGKVLIGKIASLLKSPVLPYSTAVAIIFGLLFSVGTFHGSIPLLFVFCPQEVSLEFRNGGGCSALNLAMGLKRWRLWW